MTSQNFLSATNPALSPDGEWLALSSTRDGDEDLYLYNLSSGQFTQITNNTVFVDTDPEWSPDGTTLIFASDRDRPGSTDIYTLDPFADTPEGTIERITDSRSSNSEPQFSPDGGTIAYLSITGTETIVRTLELNGQAVQSLTFAPNLRYAPPAWTADGIYIIYSQADGSEPSDGLVLQNPVSGDILTVRVDNLDVRSIVSSNISVSPSAEASASGDKDDDAETVDEEAEDTDSDETEDTEAEDSDSDESAETESEDSENDESEEDAGE
ncbi:MAG: DPP IV N-terminal domain-containing protein [Chloroflexota bacterium]